MKRWMILALTLSLTPSANAGYNVSTFEDLNPSQTVNTDNNNAGASGQFVSGGNSFNNSYDPTYGAWSGFAISSQTNITNPGGSVPDYDFEYTSVTGSGANGSLTYAVANTYGDTTDPFHPASSIVNLAAGQPPVSVQITNTAYDYFSMTYGDSFAHKFGAGDFLLLTIDGYSGANGTGTKIGEVDFYLANFLGTNSSQYYIVDTWQTVDLSSLQGASSLVFGLESSDNDPNFGINTPAEFALDDLIAGTAAVPEPSSLLLSLSGLGIVGLLIRRSTGRSTKPLEDDFR